MYNRAQSWSAEQVCTSGLAAVSQAHCQSALNTSWQTLWVLALQLWSHWLAGRIENISAAYQPTLVRHENDCLDRHWNDYFSVHVWGHGGNRFSRTSSIYDGWLKRRERGLKREWWRRSSFGHHALSPQLLFMLGLVHPEPSGDEEVVCVHVHASMCAALLLALLVMCFVFVCVCVCVSVCTFLCGIAEGEQLREGRPDL